jgi:hypothetical protein
MGGVIIFHDLLADSILIWTVWFLLLPVASAARTRGRESRCTSNGGALCSIYLYLSPTVPPKTTEGLFKEHHLMIQCFKMHDSQKQANFFHASHLQTLLTIISTKIRPNKSHAHAQKNTAKKELVWG